MERLRFCGVGCKIVSLNTRSVRKPVFGKILHPIIFSTAYPTKGRGEPRAYPSQDTTAHTLTPIHNTCLWTWGEHRSTGRAFRLRAHRLGAGIEPSTMEMED